jgi:hypothetical protein
MADIVGFFRRIFGLKETEKPGEGVPLERQEAPRQKEQPKGEQSGLSQRGKTQPRKKRKPRGKGRTKKGKSG